MNLFLNTLGVARVWFIIWGVALEHGSMVSQAILKNVDLPM